MIIDNTYFKGEIYVPHAKPGITDSVIGVDQEIMGFINEYSSECLFECLGPQLYEELLANLDESKVNKIKEGSNVKWDELVNGKTYIDPSSELTIRWKGIRWISKPSSSVYDRSFLANYVYYFYEKKEYITRSGTGHNEEMPDNATKVTPTHKVVNSWNKFVGLVQGESRFKGTIVNEKGIGLDFYGNGISVCLYKFINDMNTITENTYENFNPKVWKRINQFGI
jgi:hypothetical protein